MTSYEVVSFGLTVLGMVVSLGTFWLRLRFRLHRERERCDYLRVATALPPGSRLQEQRDDGTRLIVHVGAAAQDESS